MDDMAPVSIILNEDEILICQYYAKNAELGGRSHLRLSDRVAKLATDQMVGQLGTLAFHIWLYGRDQGRSRYIRIRDKADKNPWRGDHGNDIQDDRLPPIDIKTSLMRSLKKPPHEYFLAVRPAEHDANHLYILALICQNLSKTYAEILLMGKCRGDELIIQATSGIFGPLYGKPGAFIKKASTLHPLN